MARTPSMTMPEAEALLGPRGNLIMTKDNRNTARKWVVANGYPAVFVAGLSQRELQNAYNQLNGEGLDAISRKLAEAEANGLVEADDIVPPQSNEVNHAEQSFRAPGAPPMESAGAPAAAIPNATDVGNVPAVQSPRKGRTEAFETDGVSSSPTSQNAPAGFLEARVPPHLADKGTQLLQLLQSVGGMDKDTVEAIVQEQLSQFRDLLPDFVAACSPVTRIEIQRPDASVYRVEGITHPQFQKLIKLATSRGSDGYVPGIFIAGEASSGKTTGCRMLADALNTKWYFNGAISQAHEMLGFIDAHGNYHRTPFRDAYEYGGAYTFDEVDRCGDPAALLAVNPHLAGDRGAFPDGIVKKHKDFILLMTANTWGLGGNSDYAGATKLDAAFLSRAPVRLHWDIDEATEIHISGNETWARRVQAARQRARAAGLKVMICSRMTLAGAALIANGMTMDEAAACTYLANLKPEQRAIVEPL